MSPPPLVWHSPLIPLGNTFPFCMDLYRFEFYSGASGKTQGAPRDHQVIISLEAAGVSRDNFGGIL